MSRKKKNMFLHCMFKSVFLFFGGMLGFSVFLSLSSVDINVAVSVSGVKHTHENQQRNKMFQQDMNSTLLYLTSFLRRSLFAELQRQSRSFFNYDVPGTTPTRAAKLWHHSSVIGQVQWGCWNTINYNVLAKTPHQWYQIYRSIILAVTKWPCCYTSITQL